MSTFIITLIFCWLSWRYIYPPLALLLFVFIDPVTTPGTAIIVPFGVYAIRIVWGFLLGAALVSMIRLHRNRNDSRGGSFSWQVGVICALIVFLIRLSVVFGTEELGIEVQYDSVGPLTLIIVLGFFRDRRAWWYIGLMFIVQLGVSLYVVTNPDSILNGYTASMADLANNGSLLSEKFADSSIIGSRMQGQFGNPIALAMYASVAIAAGIALFVASFRLRANRYVYIICGILLTICGIFLLGISSSRGIMIGLIIGIVVYFFKIRGPVRLSIISLISLIFFISLPNIFYLIQDDDPFFGRFALFADFNRTELFRLEAINSSLNAVIQRPVFGFGSYESALYACKGYIAHQGPYYLSVLYGIPVGLLACLIIVQAFKSDYFLSKLKEITGDRNLAALQAFSTISFWAAMGCIMTNGYATPILINIILGLTMWPMIIQRHPHVVSPR